jgi:hypothetical protein
MWQADQAKREELVDILVDLKHDLGKYLRLPLALLPLQADQQQLRLALQTALFATRKDRESTRSARSIWDTFVAEVEPEWLLQDEAVHLRQCVEHALDWELRLQSNHEIERGLAQTDFDSVTNAIQHALDTLTGR